MAGIGLELKLSKRSQKEISDLVRSITPSENERIWNDSLTDMANFVANNAKTKQIRQGGGAPLKTKLTSRTYTLVASITPDFAKLPRAAEVIADVPYSRIHELGGTQVVSIHRRTITKAFGKTLQRPVTFPVSAHTRTYPKRPFLRPALNSQQKRFAPTVIRVINEQMERR
jgi:hypothetical protein